VFLPGEREIDDTENELRRELEVINGLPIAVYPLHAKIPVHEQQQDLAPSPGRRKVVLATSIAESSLTVVGVCHVIDTLLSRLGGYDPQTRSQTLLTKRIPRDSQKQRAGRSGRERKGKLYIMRSIQRT
jgi:ATP-dependent helicase HrpB